MVRPFNFLNEPTAKQKRSRSMKQEKRLAKKTGGKTQAGSGAVWSSKGDVKTGTNFLEDDLAFLYECKQTKGKGFRVSTDLWNEIRDKALKTEGKRPALQLELDIDEQNLHLVVIDENDWLEILDIVKNFRNPQSIGRN